MILPVLFLAAFLWRLAYLTRLADAAQLASLPADERVYWDWATYLMGHGFKGSNPFFFGPLYPYVLAMVRGVVGSDVMRVLIVQSLWGAAAAVLITDAVRRIASWPIAVFAGLLLAFYEMAVLFDGVILMESLVLFVEVLMLWLWVFAAERKAGPWAHAAIGAVTGLVALGRATGALLLLPAWWIAKRRTGETQRPALLRLAALVIGFLLTIAPASVHNWNASHEWIPFSYNFGLNLYVGNHEGATGRYVWLIGPQHVSSVKELRPDGGIEADGRELLQATEGRALSPRESSRAWADKAWSWMRAHPVAVLKLAGSKAILLWNMREQPQITSADTYRKRAGPLGLPIAGTFLFVGIVGLVGAFRAGAYPMVGPALRAYLVLFTLSMLPFFVTDRYRVHLVPPLILLSALAVDAWRRRPASAGRARRFLLPAAAATALVALPITSPPSWFNQLGEGLDMGTRWLDQGRPDLAIPEFQKAVVIDTSLNEVGSMVDPETRGALYFNYAYALRATGHPELAMPWLERAAQIAPRNPRFVRTLGDAYRVSGRTREGDSLLSRAEHLLGASSEVLLSRGYQAAREQNYAAAESIFAAAVDQNMRHYAAWGALIRIQVQRNALDRARATIERLRQTGMPRQMEQLYEAFVFAASGESSRARGILDGVPDTATQGDPTMEWVRSTTEKLIEAGGG